MKSLIENFLQNKNFYLSLVGEHLFITMVAITIAIIVGVAVGVVISEKRKIAGIVISIVNVLYTIPSIALLGVLISVTGIGNKTAIIALTLYALLPVVRSTYTGIVNIDEKIVEASEAMGSTKFQTMYKVKLPLAFPVIFSAIRNMVTMTIALAGIASFVGAGGLGVAIYRGITTNNANLLLIGSILIALLALVSDGLLGIVQRVTFSKGKKSKIGKWLLILLAAILLAVSVLGSMNHMKKTVKIASKPTTESQVLAEIVGILIEDKTDLSVKITHGVGGGTSNIHPALTKGDFHLYPEYTGTAWQIVLKEKAQYSESMFKELVAKYEEKYDATWKGMFGFNDTYSLGVRKEIADKYNLKTYSDLAKVSDKLTFGAEYDFFEREDGFNALSKAYGLNFRKKVDMDNGLKYKALLNKQIDVMTVFTTDGQLSDPRIKVLEGDKKFYPSYMAGMVVRKDILKEHPELSKVLGSLDGIIDEKTMAKLNDQVERGKKTPREVAMEFLQSKGIIKVKK